MKHLIDYHKAMSDETRIRIINLLLHAEELCVCDLEQTLNLSQPKISRHLAYLRETGLVKDRKDSLWVYYEMNNPLSPEISDQLSTFKQSVRFNELLKTDLLKLKSMADSSSCKAEVVSGLIEIAFK